MINCNNLTKFQFFLLTTAVAHAGVAVCFLIYAFINRSDYCKFDMFSLFFLTSVTEAMNINITFRLKKSNLFDPAIRSKYKWILFLGSFGKIINTILSVTWWSQSNVNPVYCSVVTQEGLSPKFGILYEFYCLYLWIFLVIALNVYTKRKFFLIAVGGPQNQVIRQNLRNLQLNIGAMQILMNNIENQNPDYHNFADVNQLPAIPQLKQQQYVEKQGENGECYVCLSHFSEDPHVPITKTKCGHIFHAQCARQWLSSGHNQCPACRTILC